MLGQADDLMSVDTEDHLLFTRQLDDEFQLLVGRMHQLDSHIALDLGNFSGGGFGGLGCSMAVECKLLWLKGKGTRGWKLRQSWHK